MCCPPRGSASYAPKRYAVFLATAHGASKLNPEDSLIYSVLRIHFRLPRLMIECPKMRSGDRRGGGLHGIPTWPQGSGVNGKYPQLGLDMDWAGLGFDLIGSVHLGFGLLTARDQPSPKRSPAPESAGWDQSMSRHIHSTMQTALAAPPALVGDARYRHGSRRLFFFQQSSRCFTMYQTTTQ